MRIKGLGCLLMVMMVMMALAGCQPSPTPAPTAVPTTPAPVTTEPAVSLSPVSPLPPPTEPAVTASAVVVDALGRTVEFPAPPQRIVVAGKAIFMLADALYLFPEAVERLVASGPASQGSAQFLPLVDAGFAQKLILESNAGAEQIAPTNPEVVVLKSYLAESLGQPLEQLGIKVVYVDLETPEQYQRDLVTLGQLFGDPARAEAVSRFYADKVAGVTQALGDVAEAQRPRVLLVQYSEKGGAAALSVPPATWIQTQMVELAGGAPVWKEAAQGGGWATVNFEQIAAWNPEQIFVIAYQSNPSEVVAKLKADPQWQALAAVQNGKVYGFPKDFYSWDQPDTRWILGLTWLAGRLHPDRFQPDMNQELVNFYGQLYGLDEAVVKDQIVPLLQGDLQ